MWLIFRNPQFRLLWIGGAFNDMGLTMYMMAHGWLALSITNSPFWVGASVGTGGLGMMGFSVFGGVLADRMDRRKLIIAAQLVQTAIAITLSVLILTDNAVLWHVLFFGLLQGAAISVKIPARLALTMDVAGRERLLSATAAVFASMTAMGVVTPLVGGVVVSTFHIGWAYVIIGCSYLLSASVLTRLDSVARTARTSASPWQDLKEGVRYVFSTPLIRTLMIMIMIVESFGWAHEAMLSVMARDVLGVGASGLGYLLAAASGGGAISTMVVSNLGDIKEKGRLLVASLVGFGFFLILFAAARWFPLSMILLAFAYASAVTYESAMSTLLQTMVPDEMRGRILSFQTFTWGLTGLAGFHTGAIATAVGAPIAIAIGGAVVLLNALRMLPSTSRYREQPADVASGD
jgi:MFS family permease